MIDENAAQTAIRDLTGAPIVNRIVKVNSTAKRCPL